MTKPPPSPRAPGAHPLWHPLAFVPLLLTAWVYRRLPHVFFYSDEFVHLKELVTEPTLNFLLSPFGGHNYLVRNTIFLGMHHLFGLRSNLYFWTVLCTHLGNVALLFGVMRLLTGSAALACLGATLWGTNPLGIGSVAWYSAYGHVLNGTVLLVPLYGVARRAAAGERLPARAAILWYVLLLAGTTCYGAGVGVALAFPAVLFRLLPSAWRQSGVRAAYVSLPIVTIVLYFAFRRLYTFIEPLSLEEMWHETLASSGFGAIPFMFVHLLAYAAAGSILGIFLPANYPTLRTWIAVAAFCGGIGLLLWRGDGATRRMTVGLIVMAATIYLLIAVGRAHLYEQFGVGFAKAAATSRYHYAGSIPMALLLAAMVWQVGRLEVLRAVPSGLAFAGGLGVLVFGALRYGLTIDEHQRCRQYFAVTQQEIAAAVAAKPPGATVYIENQTTPIYVIGMLGNRLFPGRAGVFVLTQPTDTLDGRVVRFIEPDVDVLYYNAVKPRMKELLVSPDDVPR